LVNELIARGEIEKARKKETVDDLVKKGKVIKESLEEVIEKKIKLMIENTVLS